MTAKESLLRSLAASAGEYGTEFVWPWSDLVLIVWRGDMERFGMRGYERQYPNTKAIQALVTVCVEKTGSWQKKLGEPTLKRVGVLRYRLTEEGLKIGRRQNRRLIAAGEGANA